MVENQDIVDKAVKVIITGLDSKKAADIKQSFLKELQANSPRLNDTIFGIVDSVAMELVMFGGTRGGVLIDDMQGLCDEVICKLTSKYEAEIQALSAV